MVHKVHKDSFRVRSSLVTAFLLVLLFVILARLFYLQVLQGEQTRAEAEKQHLIYQKLTPSRGQIKIFNFQNSQTEVLATNIEKYLVYAVPPEIKDAKSASEKLGLALSLDPTETLAKLNTGGKKYIILKKQISQIEEDEIKKLNLPGIYFDTESVRVYSQQNLLSQTLGFIGYKDDKTEKVGLYGLENYFEKELAGTPGELREEKGIDGSWIFGSNRKINPAADGVNLILTVDKNIQFQAETLLKDAVTKNLADSGTVVVVNPKSGAVLAMANFPDFNPNEYNKVEDPKIYSNDAATGNYEPGSIFKPITMAAAINEGKVGPDTTYEDTGSVVVDGHTIKNSDNKAHGVKTMTQVLEESLNTGIIFAKEKIGNNTFLKYVKLFGFGEPTGIELFEKKGNLDNLKGNINVNYDTASFGQGISATPIQLAEAFTAIANQGKMMRPFIVQSKVENSGKAEETKPLGSQVISAKAANTVAAMMVSVVENGHGKRAGVPGYYIAGKTGTAQVPKEDGPGYQENNNIGSFIGFGPVEDPKFLMLVRINHPRTVQFAETTAAPLFGDLAKFILNYYHVQPTR